MGLNVRSQLACGLAALVALALMLRPVQAQTPTVPVVVRIAPASVQVAAGETVDVAIEVVDVVELYGFDVTVIFDPQVVEVVDADPNLPGVQVAQGLFLDPGFAVINTADNTVGSAHFVMTQLNPSEAKSGTGSLIIVKLLGKLVGTSSLLTLVDPQLARRDGFMIPSTPASGQVDVVAGGGPTSTPMPTQGAGTPMATTTPEPTALPGTATPKPTALPVTATPERTVLPPTATATAGSPTPTRTGLSTATATPLSSRTPAPDATSPASATGGPTSLMTPPPESASPAADHSPTPAALAVASTTPQATATTVAQAQPGDSGSSQGKSASRLMSFALLVVMAVGLLAITAGAVALAVWYFRRRPGDS